MFFGAGRARYERVGALTKHERSEYNPKAEQSRREAGFVFFGAGIARDKRVGAPTKHERSEYNPKAEAAAAFRAAASAAADRLAGKYNSGEPKWKK